MSLVRRVGPIDHSRGATLRACQPPSRVDVNVAKMSQTSRSPRVFVYRRSASTRCGWGARSMLKALGERPRPPPWRDPPRRGGPPGEPGSGRPAPARDEHPILYAPRGSRLDAQLEIDPRRGPAQATAAGGSESPSRSPASSGRRLAIPPRCFRHRRWPDLPGGPTNYHGSAPRRSPRQRSATVRVRTAIASRAWPGPPPHPSAQPATPTSAGTSLRVHDLFRAPARECRWKCADWDAHEVRTTGSRRRRCPSTDSALAACAVGRTTAQTAVGGTTGSGPSLLGSCTRPELEGSGRC